MNTHDLTHTGGFPFDQATIDFYQESIALAMAPAALVGPLGIVKGCVVAGANAGDGVVAINGELLPFVGGQIQDKVVIVEEINSLRYLDDVVRPVQKIRWATFGDDGVTNMLWANFKRNTEAGVLARLEALEVDNTKLKLMAAPFIAGGGMVLWRKPFNEIPAGWREVEDWRARLPIGYDPGNVLFDEPGADFGGSFDVALTAANMPRQNVPLPANVNGVNGSGGIKFEGANNNTFNIGIGNVNPTAVNIANPYRVVVFIEPIPQA